MPAQMSEAQVLPEKMPALQAEEDSSVENLGSSDKIGTRTDHQNMVRMGKHQELRVQNFPPQEIEYMSDFNSVISVFSQFLASPLS